MDINQTFRFAIPVPHGKLTAPFNQPRPLGKKRSTHIHGAIDIAPDQSNVIVAPEAGLLRGYVAVRPTDGMHWPAAIMIDNLTFPFANYFYDMFGGVLILRVPNGSRNNTLRTHVITHSWGNQIFDGHPLDTARTHWIEESDEKRFPIHAIYTDEIKVGKGQTIGRVGNAGFSTGKHIHWECHHGYRWQRHDERINPQEHVYGLV